MTLHAQTEVTIPEETVRVAHAAYPHGNPLMKMRDALGTMYPLDAQRVKEGRKDGLSCHLKRLRPVDQKRSDETLARCKEAGERYQRKTSEKRLREDEHKGEVESSSGAAKTERRGKGIWYPEELDRDIWSSFRARIACQAFSPGETPMCSLGTRDQSDWLRLSRWSRFSKFDIDTLMT